MPRKKTILFFAVLIISFISMTYQSRKIHTTADNLIVNVLNRFHDAAQSLTDGVKGPFKRMALREEENTLLKKRLAELMAEKERYQEAAIENRRLRELLKLRGTEKTYIATARVIARGTDRWTNTLVLDKGMKDGVNKDMSAVTAKGLSGKIIQASDSYSYLLLVTDITFSAAVRVQESRKEAILSGTGTRKCILKYVPYEQEMKAGDIVITSGLDQLFPPGVPVGYVSAVDSKGRGGTFQYIEVIPFQDGSTLEEVNIVK